MELPSSNVYAAEGNDCRVLRVSGADGDQLEMVTRSFWKGYLKLSLVTCRVAMQPATTESERIRFHTLNARTGNRVVSRYVDSQTGKSVDDDATVRGYPRGENDYVPIEADELAALALESTRTIDVDTFVPHESIEWIWYDKPHYLMPDDNVSEEAFAVIRDAMAATGTVGIARLVLYRRERAVMLKPGGKGIVVWTLRYGDEVRDANPYFDTARATRPEAGLMKLVTQLIDKRTAPWTSDMVVDPVQANLRDIIARKKKGRKSAARTKPKPEPAPSNVVNIMDALKKSIAAERRGK